MLKIEEVFASYVSRFQRKAMAGQRVHVYLPQRCRHSSYVPWALDTVRVSVTISRAIGAGNIRRVSRLRIFMSEWTPWFCQKELVRPWLVNRWPGRVVSIGYGVFTLLKSYLTIMIGLYAGIEPNNIRAYCVLPLRHLLAFNTTKSTKTSMSILHGHETTSRTMYALSQILDPPPPPQAKAANSGKRIGRFCSHVICKYRAHDIYIFIYYILYICLSTYYTQTY